MIQLPVDVPDTFLNEAAKQRINELEKNHQKEIKSLNRKINKLEKEKQSLASELRRANNQNLPKKLVEEAKERYYRN